MACCPAHDDRNPSLSINDRDGHLLVKCHAGCSQSAVVSALKSRNLWPATNSPRRTVVAEYTYRDEKGTPLYRVCRTEPKGFFQQRWSGGQWLNGGLNSVRRVLYRLPEVLEAPIVFLVEGEKDVETLRLWGFVATTAAGGAKAEWLPEYTDTLRGREVIVIPDNDKPGWERAVSVCRELVGNVARLRILDLPEEVKDITDWSAVGHSNAALVEILEATPHAV
jgi:hypothetical protein